METLPKLGTVLYGAEGPVMITRITALSGEHRWVYYKNLDTNEWHGLRLNLFLERHSENEYEHLIYS